MSIRSELVKYCHKVYEKGFVAAYDGNLSIRLDSSKILITPSGKCKGEIREEDLIEIDYDGNVVSGSGKASTESKIHLLAYKRRSDIDAVVHCHPVHATAFAAIGEGFTTPIFPEVILSLGKVPLCKYSTPSTDELPKSMEPYIDFAYALLFENHGAVTFAKTIKGAYFRMEKLEHAAQILSVARSMGREKTIPNLKLKELYNIAESTYGIKINKNSRMDY
ncbi:MAG: class II aldolase/adducin family protein [Melioribacteraceae bacterium]|jgi:L-fuculose-phosphate aldolase|nr:class II aldolase/adducin family protein [Melioribacteraceae bacterium]RJP58863.1 MAG: class II aldolase/adducin family protein [Ignavibacteriales bacterium]WKZ70428.1 MAG: class II aldolase/adducin family protein [Melioribacteraceae bacterium]